MDKENQPITSGIKHWGLGGYASVLPRIKFSVTGQDSSPQSPTFHTADRYRLFYRTAYRQTKLHKKEGKSSKNN